jgi:flagellar hook-basal body complex protein FliE
VSIQPVGPASPGATSPVAGLSPMLPAVETGADAVSGAAFDAALGRATGSNAVGGGLGAAIIDRLEQGQALAARSDDLAIKAVTGQLADPSQYTIAATEAGLFNQMTVALRNKAVEAYSEIMRMQL